MGRYKITVVILIAAALAVICLIQGCGLDDRFASTGVSEHVLVIDPGHGGMDGGASSDTGITEKDINLAIALKLKKLAEEYGWEVVMTREKDEWLCGDIQGAIRTKKTEDLRKRCELIRDVCPELAVSIHMNSYKEDPSVSGAQVFYPAENSDGGNGTRSEELAKVIQASLNESVPAGNREAMTRDGVFIFRNVTCPIVIIECGFLSNPQEAERLNTGSYQMEIAEAVMRGITEFTGVKMPANVEIIDSLE